MEIQIKTIIDEDFVNYKKPSMFIAFPKCSFKCEVECGKKICQNSDLAKSPSITISTNEIVRRYISNPITKAIVIGGLEPFDSKFDLIALVKNIRQKTNDDIVIYTGYTEDEISDATKELSMYFREPNIMVKYGRYIPNQEPHYDEKLGVKLASDNQYAKKI